MSHIKISNLSKQIDFIRKHSKIPICIDTEGSQIRTKVKKEILFKKRSQGQIIKKIKFLVFTHLKFFLI